MSEWQRFRLKQDGIPVAWTEGPNAMGEIMHYALIYSKDAPVKIEVHDRVRWKQLSSVKHSAQAPTPIG